MNSKLAHFAIFTIMALAGWPATVSGQNYEYTVTHTISMEIECGIFIVADAHYVNPNDYYD